MWYKLQNTPGMTGVWALSSGWAESDTSERKNRPFILSIWIALKVPIQEALMKLRDLRKAADCQMQNRISLPDRAPTKILWPREQRIDKPGSINDEGLQVWSNFSVLLNVPFWLKMQELGPLLHKVASLFYMQFLFLNFNVVFQLWQGQALKQGPEELCGFHPCAQNSFGQDAEQNDLILCALSWAED